MTGFGYNVHGFGAGGTLVFNITISSSTNDFNLESYLSSNTNYNGTDRVTINVTIDADVVVGSTSHTTPAFQTGTIGFATTGSILNITNNGTIQGAGGRGGTLASGNGTGTNADGKLDRNGGDGGTALTTTMTTIIDGGGGGGAGAVADTVGASGGGGGAGTVGGSGGSGNGSEGQSGSSGNASSGGSGGSHASGNSGGNGGGIGSAGSNGSGSGAFAVGSGGSAGKYLVGNSNTTFTANGTRTGDVS